MADKGAKKNRFRGTFIALVILAAVAGGFAWWKLLREVPQQLADDSMEEVFKYGSIGTEKQDGIPFWIWLVLPKMFPEYLPGPGGWASLGFVWEQGRELPVGFTKKVIGFERVGVNCALCHSATLRESVDAVPKVYVGGPASTVDILAYQRFLFKSASDPRFNAGNVLTEIRQIYAMSFIDRLLYRFLLIPLTRKALLEQKQQFAWTDTRPDWGRGRIDPFNPVKVRILDVSAGDTIGNSDMQPIWNMGPRVEHNMALHWDGLNTDLTEVVLSSAIGDGTIPKSLPIEQLKRLEDWIKDLEPPKFAQRFAIDQGMAATGKPLYEQHCAECHAFDGEKTGRVLPLEDSEWRVEGLASGSETLYTDRHRVDMWTAEAAEAYNAYADDYPWDFDKFRSPGGYVNVPLDAIWLRAPYLHNGSVPYLAELLERPENRTRTFYRGYDVYDPVRLGFISEGPDAQRFGTVYDTNVEGNSNQGHLWGTELEPQQKKSLLEYLKTL